MKHCHVYLLFIFLLVACTNEISINFDEFKPEIVVNCLFTESEYFNVEVLTTKVVNDTSNCFVENALVSIYALNSNESHNLPYLSEGFYADTTFFPVIGQAYKIEVNVQGFETLWAIDSLPAAPSVKINSLIKTSINLDKNEYIKVHDLNMTLADPPGINNYYRFVAYYRVPQKYPEENLFEVDNMWTNEPLIVTEIENQLIFCDQMFDGQTFDIDCKVTCPVLDEVPLLFDIYIITLSQTFFDYEKKYYRHKYAYPDVFFPVEPIMMPTNIANGYGVFAGYSILKFSITQSN